MTFFEGLIAPLDARFCCRAFRPDPALRTDVERIIETARKVPSRCNAKPWQASARQRALGS